MPIVASARICRGSLFMTPLAYIFAAHSFGLSPGIPVPRLKFTVTDTLLFQVHHDSVYRRVVFFAFTGFFRHV